MALSATRVTVTHRQLPLQRNRDLLPRKKVNLWRAQELTDLTREDTHADRRTITESTQRTDRSCVLWEHCSHSD